MEHQVRRNSVCKEGEIMASNEDLVRRYVDGLNSRDTSVIGEVISPDVQTHALFYNPYTPSGVRSAGSPLEAIEQAIADQHQQFSDMQVTLDQVMSTGDKVIAVGTTRATRDGKQLSWITINILRVAGDRIVEVWSLWDRLGYYQQLGVVPETPELLQKAGLPT
jgi:ketosteroid isomerase-like protein